MARMVSQMFVYSCVATLLALGLGLGYMWSSGKLSGEKAFKILAVVHDVDLASPEVDQTVAEDKSQEEMSYDEIEKLRDIRSRDLELKIVAMNKGIEELRWRRELLTEDKTRYELIKTNFDTTLAELSGQSTRQGFANVRQLWETIPPKLVKQQIMAMVEEEEIDDVVIILADMPNVKKGKIVQQFTVPDEIAVMDDILRKIRLGLPTKPVIDQARRAIQSAQPAQP